MPANPARRITLPIDPDSDSDSDPDSDPDPDPDFDPDSQFPPLRLCAESSPPPSDSGLSCNNPMRHEEGRTAGRTSGSASMPL
ncbi:MAG: hypothetical protein ACOX52_16205 [Verrucomicrobiota bacterium]